MSCLSYHLHLLYIFNVIHPCKFLFKVNGKNGVPGPNATPLALVAKESEHELAQLHLPSLEAITTTASASQLRQLHALMMLMLLDAARTLFRGSEPPAHPFIKHLVKTGPVQVGSEP